MSMNRQEAIKLARKIHDIRAKRVQGADGKLTYHTLLRLKEMDPPKRQDMMERLVREGFAESVEAIKKMMNSKAVMDGVFGTAYCPSAGMSDKKLDPGTHY